MGSVKLGVGNFDVGEIKGLSLKDDFLGECYLLWGYLRDYLVSRGCLKRRRYLGGGRHFMAFLGVAKRHIWLQYGISIDSDTLEGYEVYKYIFSDVV